MITERTMLRSVRWAVIVAVLGSVIAAGCASLISRHAPRLQPPSPGVEQPRLGIRLSDVGSAPLLAEAPHPVNVEPLDPHETAALLRRLPPLQTRPRDERMFALREGSLPPPQVDRTETAPFPPAAHEGAPDVSPAGPLEISRSAPAGDVDIAPNFSITFSEPMVAVTSHEQAANSVPVRLTPQPEGRWRWVGTKTLIFEAGERLPMAMEFRAEVPAGTRSANGAVLATDFLGQFRTPPVTILHAEPDDRVAVGRDPIVFLAFNQNIDVHAMQHHLIVQAGDEQTDMRLATPDEIEADPTVRRLVASTRAAHQDNWIALRPTHPLPLESRVRVTVPAGAPSAEGPRLTEQPQEFSFHTYGSFRVAGHTCGYSRQKPSECPPAQGFSIELTNPIDAESFHPSDVRVEPAVAGMEVHTYGNGLGVRGNFRGRTAYAVKLPPDMRDRFGQKLGNQPPLEFKTGAAEPLLAAVTRFVVLNPDQGQSFPVYSINFSTLRVRVYEVAPSDWAAFVGFTWCHYEREQCTPPGRLRSDSVVQVQGQPDALTETRIDLRPFTHEGAAQLVLVVEPPNPPEPKAWWYGPPVVRTWIQLTRMSLSAAVDRSDIHVWVNRLSDNKPMPSVQLTAGAGSEAMTGDDGLAVLPIPEKGTGVLVGRTAADLAILPAGIEPARYSPLLIAMLRSSDWMRPPEAARYDWYVADDRGLYRPGEEVHLKGWIRPASHEKGGDIYATDPSITLVDYTVVDSQDNSILTGESRVNAFGGFDAAFALPENVHLGTASVRLEAGKEVPCDEGGMFAPFGAGTEHAFQVQEFRRPEYEVKAVASGAPYFVGGHAEVTATASYFAGGGLPDADVHWTVTTRPAAFVPPNRSNFIFGSEASLWWLDVDEAGDVPPESVLQHDGRTALDGTHTLRLDFESAQPAFARRVTAEATIHDVNRQAWSGSTELLVHPASLYVGLSRPKPFAAVGETIAVDAIVTDLDGNAVSRPISVEMVRLEWQASAGGSKRLERDPQRCEIVTGTDPARCNFEARRGGIHRIRARLANDQGRRSETEVSVWVMGGPSIPAPGIKKDTVTLVSNKPEYRAGDVAEIMVQAPWAPAEGVLTLRRSGVVHAEHFPMETMTHVLRIPIEEHYTPNIYVQVDLAGTAEPLANGGKPRGGHPAFASGKINLVVPPYERTLRVAVAPPTQNIQPGGHTTVDVTVRNPDEQPAVDAEVAVAVVDEAVLSVSGYRMPNPLDVFYVQRPSDTYDYHLRRFIYVPAAGTTPDEASLRMAQNPETLFRKFMRDGGEAAEKPLKVRSDFNPLALFAPSVRTDEQGHARVSVTVPGNLTRYRVMAIAATKGREFGAGEATITASLPLMAQPSPPRFLNFGDRFELPVVVQNHTDAELTASVIVRGANAEITGDRGIRVAVPAQNRVELRFPGRTSLPGTARFQVAAAAGASSDAAAIELPVWTPATTEAFATYGTIDSGTVSQPVRAPGDAVPQYGKLALTTSSTGLHGLTDAGLYMNDYPFECAEQIASRVITNAVLHDLVSAFQHGALPSAEKLQERMRKDLGHLQGMQKDNGCFGFWPDREPDAFVSIHVAHALQRAKEKGFAVPGRMLGAARECLASIPQLIPTSYPAYARYPLMAYALYVAERMGKPDVAKARALIGEAGGVSGLSIEALGWLLPTLRAAPEAAEIYRHLGNRVTDTAEAAHFATAYFGGAGHLLLHSENRSDAVVLEALIKAQPRSELIPKLAAGLLAHRKAGRWQGTQENVWSLIALTAYFNAYEKTTPDFLARAWLGARYAGEHRFVGRTTERHEIDVPMALLGAGTQDVILAKEGPGRLYYRLGLEYAPRNLMPPAVDHGFAVERRYEAVDDPSDVAREIDGAWQIKAGARVRITVTMVAPERRYQVALVDPLPAGLEPLNPVLRLEPHPQPAERDAGEWTGLPICILRLSPWYDHENLRDNRAEVFASVVGEGVYSYSYVTRATTPGQFIAPPPKAEEMYNPETFGRGRADRVIVN